MQLCNWARVSAYIGVGDGHPMLSFSYRIRALCVLDALNVWLNITKRISDMNGVCECLCASVALCEQ